MDQQITTRAERVSVNLAPTPEAEPTMTVSQFATLLHAAADLERAQRPPAPIVISGPEAQPANVVHPTGHPGIDVRFPSPAEAAGIVAPWAPLRHPGPARFAWGVRLAYAGVSVLLAGAAGAAVTDGNGIAIGAAVVGIGAVIGGTARATAEENQREARS